MEDDSTGFFEDGTSSNGDDADLRLELPSGEKSVLNDDDSTSSHDEKVLPQWQEPQKINKSPMKEPALTSNAGGKRMGMLQKMMIRQRREHRSVERCRFENLVTELVPVRKCQFIEYPERKKKRRVADKKIGSPPERRNSLEKHKIKQHVQNLESIRRPTTRITTVP